MLGSPGACPAAAFALVIATWPAARRPYGASDRDEAPPLRASPRRLVLEGTAVFLAVAGALLLRQRGLAVAGDEVRFDPFLAAVPVLAAMAVGIVLLRVYPFPIRACGWLAARRRDLVPVLGLRNVGRHSAAVALPLLVLMLTAAFSAFASVVSVERRSRPGRSVVGRRWAPTTGSTPSRAPACPARSTRMRSRACRRGRVRWSTWRLHSKACRTSAAASTSTHPCSAAYADVVEGSPAAVTASRPRCSEAADPGAGTPDRPIPAIISRRLPSGSTPLNPGATFLLTVRGQPMTMEVVEVRETFAGVPPETAFVVASLEQLAAAYRNPPLLPSTVLLRGPESIEQDAETTFAEQSTSVRFTRGTRSIGTCWRRRWWRPSATDSGSPWSCRPATPPSP